ncbi:hypothetical protein ABH942_003076 [Flavobacterium sp. 28YEA47A]
MIINRNHGTSLYNPERRWKLVFNKEGYILTIFY